MLKPKTPISGRLDNSSGEWIRTTDLRVMSPTSYLCSTPHQLFEYSTTPYPCPSTPGGFSHPILTPRLEYQPDGRARKWINLANLVFQVAHIGEVSQFWVIAVEHKSW